jgi:hypothetical protein
MISPWDCRVEANGRLRQSSHLHFLSSLRLHGPESAPGVITAAAGAFADPKFGAP